MSGISLPREGVAEIVAEPLAAIADLYRKAARAACFFDPGKRTDRGFMDVLAELETALVGAARSRGESLNTPGIENAILCEALAPEEKFRQSLRPMSRDALMTLALEQQETRKKGDVPRMVHGEAWRALIAQWQEDGAAVDEVSEVLVPPDAGYAPPARRSFAGAAEGPDKNPTNRLEKIGKILEDNGIGYRDLILHLGIVLPEQMRKAPYLLIDIPSRDLQIAVCEETKEITFVSREIRPVSFWARNGKAALKCDPMIYPVKENERWDKKIDAHFGDDYLRKVQSVWDGPFIEEGKSAGKPKLTRDYLRYLVECYQEKEGEDPSQDRSKPVWGWDRKTEEWVRIDDSWKAIGLVLRRKHRECEVKSESIAQFLDEESLRKHKKASLTNDYLTQLVRWFQEKEGKDPTQNSETVWVKNEDGEFVADPSECWRSIHSALNSGIRGADSSARSLAQFLDNSGLRKHSEPHATGLAQRKARTEAEVAAQGGGAPPPPAP